MLHISDIERLVIAARNRLGKYVNVEINICAYAAGKNEIRYAVYDAASERIQRAKTPQACIEILKDLIAPTEGDVALSEKEAPSA